MVPAAAHRPLGGRRAHGQPQAVGGMFDGAAASERGVVWGQRNPGLGDGATEGRTASSSAPAGRGL